MIKPKQRWTHQEYLAYILLFAAHADSHYSSEEKEHILSKIAHPVYERALKEFSKDNDYKQIQTILMYQKINQFYSNDTVIQEFQDLFLADSEFHPTEKYMLSIMKRLLPKKV